MIHVFLSVFLETSLFRRLSVSHDSVSAPGVIYSLSLSLPAMSQSAASHSLLFSCIPPPLSIPLCGTAVCVCVCVCVGACALAGRGGWWGSVCARVSARCVLRPCAGVCRVCVCVCGCVCVCLPESVRACERAYLCVCVR